MFTCTPVLRPQRENKRRHVVRCSPVSIFSWFQGKHRENFRRGKELTLRVMRPGNTSVPRFNVLEVIQVEKLLELFYKSEMNGRNAKRKIVINAAL